MVWKKLRWNVINEVDNVTREELMSINYVIICFEINNRNKFQSKIRIAEESFGEEKEKNPKKNCSSKRGLFQNNKN